MTNTTTIIGRLTKDPELRTTSNGVSVVSFTIAVERNYKGSDGEKITDFIPVIAWRKTAEIVSKYLSKGSLCSVTGALQTRNFVASDGSNRTIMEVNANHVHFLPSLKKAVRKEDPITNLPF